MENALSTLVGGELGERLEKWMSSVAGVDGSIYGIPLSARRVVKFNPIDKCITHIGPDFEPFKKWTRGAITDSGIIYCTPFTSNHGILKIDTNTDTVTELNDAVLPEQGYKGLESCAAAHDGCVYFMPYYADRIMKLDANNIDSMSSVRHDLGNDDLGNVVIKYIGTVVGIDRCLYGIPHDSTKSIIKYDPINDTASFVGERSDEPFHCGGSGVLGRDGCIYVLGKNYRLRVLKIDTTNNSYCFVGNTVEADFICGGWGDPILGIDGCIYWPPQGASRILKYDPYTNQTLMVGDDYGNRDRSNNKWRGGALASDGAIYCIPSNANHILCIDPFKEFSMNVKDSMEEDPHQFGFLFQTTGDDKGSTTSQTNFDHAVNKFGHKKVFEVLGKHMKPVNDFCKISSLCAFMIVASSKVSTVGTINHFLKQDLSWVNCVSTCSVEEGNALTNKKRKYNYL